MYKNSKYFYGYASVFNNKDAHGDIIMDESLNTPYIQGESIPLLLEHNPRKKIGIVQKVSQNSKGVFVEGFIDFAYAKQNLPLSVGYIINKSFKCNNGIRYIQKFTLLEVSVVKKSANPMAYGFCPI